MWRRKQRPLWPEFWFPPPVTQFILMICLDSNSLRKISLMLIWIMWRRTKYFLEFTTQSYLRHRKSWGKVYVLNGLDRLPSFRFEKFPQLENELFFPTHFDHFVDMEPKISREKKFISLKVQSIPVVSISQIHLTWSWIPFSNPCDFLLKTEQEIRKRGKTFIFSVDSIDSSLLDSKNSSDLKMTFFGSHLDDWSWNHFETASIPSPGGEKKLSNPLNRSKSLLSISFIKLKVSLYHSVSNSWEVASAQHSWRMLGMQASRTSFALNMQSAGGDVTKRHNELITWIQMTNNGSGKSEYSEVIARNR